ncbi:MAG TPA: nuclear transport factor 2 family protein [Solirubrobacterales bacterium]|nr:nuclear transport factor 2 family protein [Solirubrobacterales bacterium]
MPNPHPFRRAAEAKDLDQLRETLNEDVVLHSPILFNGFEGRDATLFVLSNVIQVFEDFHYTDELHGEDTVTLRFKARVADGQYEIEGIDFLELDSHGRVVELTVFLRPLKAVNAFNELMIERLGAAPPA